MTAIQSPDLRSLTADLSAAPDGVAPKVRAVVSKGALNIKTQLRDEMGASRSFGVLARSIGYDIIEEDDGVLAEIGPRKVASASSTKPTHKGANIAYFGNPRGGGGTVPDPMYALDAEEPQFLAALEAVLGESL